MLPNYRHYPVLLASLLLPFAGWSEELSPRDSSRFADFIEGHSYEANELPHEAAGGMLFARRASGAVVSESVADGSLTFQTENPGTLSYHAGVILPAGVEVIPWWTERVDSAKGYTVEFRLRALSGEYGFSLIASPSEMTPEAQVLTVMADGVWWGKTRLDRSANDDDFHLFRLVKHPGVNHYQVWRDGVLIGEHLSGNLLAEGRFWFGDWSGKLGGGVLDYLRWDTTGAYLPPEEPLN